MKKFIILGFLLAIVSIMATGCSSCQSENKKQESGVGLSVLTPENTISTDREYMSLNVSNDYRWYETIAIVLTDWLDAENQTGSIESIDNVFQVVTADAFGGDSEDFPLNEETIKLTFKQAYEKVMATNSPKPHSKRCVLRLPIGPKPCNVQWCFGNIEEQLLVDAVTGEVRNFNPAFEGFNGTGYGGLPLNQ